MQASIVKGKHKDNNEYKIRKGIQNINNIIG